MLEHDEINNPADSEANKIEKSDLLESTSNISQSFADLKVDTNKNIDDEARTDDSKGILISVNDVDFSEKFEKEGDANFVRQPIGDRWQLSHPSVNLSGQWELIVSNEWKKDYDVYLASMGYNIFLRKVALTVIQLTKEEILHWNANTPTNDCSCDDDVSNEIASYEKERRLRILSTNPKGTWDRTYISSGATNPLGNHSSEPQEYQKIILPIKTANGDPGESECWWERNGTVHRSWIRNAPQGDYESLRYLEEGSEGNIYVCESYFYEKKNEDSFSPTIPEKANATAQITWRFQRKIEESV